MKKKMKHYNKILIILILFIRIALLLGGDYSFIFCGENNGGMSPLMFAIYITCCFIGGALVGTYIRKTREAKELEAALTAQKEISAKEELLKNEDLLRLELENQLNDNQVWYLFGGC